MKDYAYKQWWVREDQYLPFLAGREKTRSLIKLHDQEEKAESLNGQANELESAILSLGRGIRNLERNVKEHEQKIDDYKSDPDKHDNKGELQGVSAEFTTTKSCRENQSSGKAIKKEPK